MKTEIKIHAEELAQALRDRVEELQGAAMQPWHGAVRCWWVRPSAARHQIPACCANPLPTG